MKSIPQIIFDAERMKYPHTGIFHYCQHLMRALLHQQKAHTNQLGIYLPSNVTDYFQKDIFRISQSSFHKLSMPSLERFKVWHSTYQGTSYFPFRGNHKIAFTIHDLNFLYEKSTIQKQQKYLRLLQQKINRADAIIAISEFVKREVETHLKVDKTIKVIYNGCNIIDGIIPVKPDMNINFPFIFSIGAITSKKNFHILPASITNNDHHLIIAGVMQNADYLKKIMEQAKALNVQERVHYIGPVTEPQKYWLMQNCSLFAFPSIAEGFGLPVIEAMYFGKPVLLSSATSLMEIGGSCAFYLNNFDADHVSLETNKVIKNTSAELSMRSKEWSRRFDWQTSAKEYWNVYEKLCNG